MTGTYLYSFRTKSEELLAAEAPLTEAESMLTDRRSAGYCEVCRGEQSPMLDAEDADLVRLRRGAGSRVKIALSCVVWSARTVRDGRVLIRN